MAPLSLRKAPPADHRPPPRCSGERLELARGDHSRGRVRQIDLSPSYTLTPVLATLSEAVQEVER